MDISAKICSNCKQELDISCFHKHRREKDGYRTICKPCRKILEVRDPIKRKICRNKPENKKKEIEYGKLYRERNREKSRQYARDRYPKIKQYQKEWQKKNYNKNKKNNPLYKLSHSMSGRLTDFLKNKKANRHWEDILGFTAKDLKDRMESLFTDGMTFENYGKNGWHIDHIIPLKYKNNDGSYYFNQDELLNENTETFKKAWGLENLQPLWGSDNLKKSNRYIG